MNEEDIVSKFVDDLLSHNQRIDEFLYDFTCDNKYDFYNGEYWH